MPTEQQIKEFIEELLLIRQLKKEIEKMATKTDDDKAEKEPIHVPNGPMTVVDPAIKNMVCYVEAARYDEAVTWIRNKAKEEEQIIQRMETFDAYPSDGAHAFTQVLKEVYGWIEQKPIRTFFGEKPPVTLVIQTSYNTTQDVPWGEIAVPNIEGKMLLGSTNERGVNKFVIGAQVKKKDMHKVRDLVDRTREYLKTGSIYKGKAVRLDWVSENTMFNSEEAFDTPQFLPPSSLGINDLILPEIIYEEINATVFSLISNAQKAREMNIPTKRLVLLAGPYGTGKTLTATITANLCQQMGRTFLYLREVEHLADAIYFAQQYGPACVFAEDIDRVSDVDMIDKISNTIDGVDTKGIDTLFILTTNHVERIPKKFLRSGRSDMIIQMQPPDAEAAGRLIMRYGGHTLVDGFNKDMATTVGESLARHQMIPASIREVVERAKLFALARGNERIDAKDLTRAAHGVGEQCEMLKEERPGSLPAHLEEVGTLVRNRNGNYQAANAG